MSGGFVWGVFVLEPVFEALYPSPGETADLVKLQVNSANKD